MRKRIRHAIIDILDGATDGEIAELVTAIGETAGGPGMAGPLVANAAFAEHRRRLRQEPEYREIYKKI